MSPRRRQSTKDLGAILKQAVPPIVAEEVQQPAERPVLAPEQEEPAAEQPAADIETPSPIAADQEDGSLPEPETRETSQSAASPPAETGSDASPQQDQEPMVASQQSRMGEPPAAEPEAPPLAPITWRKSTIPFREDQYQEIGHILAEFHFRHDVQLTVAEVVRLGLDKIIEALKDDEQLEQILVEIYQQQCRESQGNENLKHSKSRGLGDYLAAHGLLST